MIAMQYSFTLPADYDMGIVIRRIEENGHKLDGFPGLVFKAYLYALRGEQGAENRYAPFYLWQDSAAMRRFLCSPGFAALTAAFGWPAIDLWPLLHMPDLQLLRQCRWASRRINSILPHSDLPGVCLPAPASHQLTAWNPASWQHLRMTFSSEEIAQSAEAEQRYRIGYLSFGCTTENLSTCG